MSKNPSFFHLLQEINAKAEYDKLEKFHEPDCWNSMSSQDKHLLATLFVKAGESKLKSGDVQYAKLFDLAVKISSSSPQIFYLQGQAFAEHEQNIGCLLKAVENFKKVIALNESCFEAWQALGQVLTHLGKHYEEGPYFREADEKFSKAEKLLPEDVAMKAKFYWQWGLSWHYCGTFSEEVCDFVQALNKFKQAEELGYRPSIFWNDYGRTLMGLGYLLKRDDLFDQAAEYFRKAIWQTPNYFEALFNLGTVLLSLFTTRGEEEVFLEADKAFKKASEISGEKYLLWLRWGALLMTYGKYRRSLPHIETSLGKFATANRCLPNQPYVYRLWGEALRLLGSRMECLNTLRQSEFKILKSLDICPEDSMTWYYYGLCLNEFGRYFDEEKYFLQAIEKFELALKSEDNKELLYFGIGQSYLGLGEITQDKKYFEKACEFFAIAQDVAREYPSIWNEWGVALMRQGEISGDVAYFEDAVAKLEYTIESTPKGCVLAEWYYNCGCALDFMGELKDDASYYESSVQMLTKAILADPGYLDACYNLAVALTHLGEVSQDIECYNKAIELFKTVVTHTPEDDMAWNELGMTLLHLSQMIDDPAQPEMMKRLVEDAEMKLIRAASLGNIPALYNLACLYSLTGQLSASMHYFEKCASNAGLPFYDEIMMDPWLEALRKTGAFQEFMNYLVPRDEENI